MNTTAEIYDLMETTGKSAPDITQALKKHRRGHADRRKENRDLFSR